MRLAAGDAALMVFSHLALHEHEQKTLAELARAVRRPAPVVLKALQGLVADNLVLAQPKPSGTGRGDQYRVNTANPIFPELRQIVVKMLGGTRLLRDAIEHNEAVDAAAIFGSVAAGTDRRGSALSDIDLLVIFTDDSSPDDRFAVRAAISAIGERLNRQIDVQASLRSEWDRESKTNRVLRRIATGDLITLKGTI